MPGLIQRIREEGFQEGYRKGYQEGYRKGFRKGYQEGFQKGFRKGRVKTIHECLQERFGDVSDEIIQKLEAIQDIDQLKSLFKTALHCTSLWEFEQNM